MTYRVTIDYAVDDVQPVQTAGGVIDNFDGMTKEEKREIIIYYCNRLLDRVENEQ